ncbi:hypothetical protein [Paenibacillus validus]|uniref:hypothetical protein n=1 Tax=Paenibacillus validus TaxID=44253 RepID=UPI003D2C8DA4
MHRKRTTKAPVMQGWTFEQGAVWPGDLVRLPVLSPESSPSTASAARSGLA